MAAEKVSLGKAQLQAQYLDTSRAAALSCRGLKLMGQAESLALKYL